MLLCEAAGFDVILVETVGVGQSETAVKSMVDFFLLLMLAGAGDELQGIKKGIMEMADGIFINKADGDNVDEANKAKANYQQALHLFQMSNKNWSTPVMTGSSVTGEGLPEIWKSILEYERKMKFTGFWNHNRADQRVKWLDEYVHFLLGKAFLEEPKIQKMLASEKEKVRSGELSPLTFARDLTRVFLSILKSVQSWSD